MVMSKIKNPTELFINQDVSILEAMKQLNKTAKRVLFVVDEYDRLVGTITDGDIRRYIIKTGSLDGKVKDTCNKNPLVGHIGYNKNELIKKAKELDVQYIPIISEDGKIVEILIVEEKEFASKIAAVKSIDIPAVIMAGGLGTRLEPITKVIPKPLIPIGEKTILEHIIENLAQYGINRFWISVNYKAYIIKSYLSEINLPYFIEYIQEEKPLGTAGSLYLLKGKIDSNLFILTNCDILLDIDYLPLIQFHTEQKNDITIVVSAQRHRIPYGVCEVEDGELKRLVEKPEIDLLVNTGMYVINTDVLNIIPDNTFFHATDLIQKAKSEGKKIGIYPVSEDAWVDIGQWEEYKKAIRRINI